ncbi:MAG: hypothetical protein NC202_13175, partial [Roseburia sp.]|nr:hypothetical protein [Roseburia sp.]
MKRKNTGSGMTRAAILCALAAILSAGCSEGEPIATSAETTTSTEASLSDAPSPASGETEAGSTTSPEAVNIGLDEAKKTVLAHAGLNETEVTFLKVKLEKDDGVSEYDIEFLSDSTKYEYEIRAEDGALLEFSAEAIADTATETAAQTTTSLSAPPATTSSAAQTTTMPAP